MATLFSGAGGLDSGFMDKGNFKMIFANDVLDAPAESYSKNFKHKIIHAKQFDEKTRGASYVVGDITDIDFAPLGEVDCMVGGPPCQDFSIARGGQDRRKGIEITRGALYLQYVRAVKTTTPKFFAFENVPGLISANGGLAYETILNDFSNQGYQILFKNVVNATHVGVPQSRKRLIILGIRNDIAQKISDDVIDKINCTLTGCHNSLRKYPLCAMEALEGKTIPQLQKKYSSMMKEYEGVEKETNTSDAMQWKKNVWDNLTFDVVEDYIFVNGIKNTSGKELSDAFNEHEKILKQLGYFGKNVRDEMFGDGSNEIPKESSSVMERMYRIPPGQNHLTVRNTEWDVKGTMSNIYRRTDPLRPAFTVMAYGGGGTWSYHYERNRSMLTNRERARLQTFPDTYMFFGSRSQIRTQIGEAVPSQLGRKIAEIATFVLEST